MPNFIQGAQGKVVGGTSASAPFGSNNTASNLLVLAIAYYDNTVLNHSIVGMTVTDTHGNSWVEAGHTIYPSGGIQVSIWYVLSCGAGANTINVTSAHSGVMFLAAHEAAPDAGQAFVFDAISFGNGVSTGNASVTAKSSGPVQYNNEYQFSAVGIDNITNQPIAFYPGSSSPFVPRQYIANNTPQNAFSPPMYGQLSTYDSVANILGLQIQFQAAPSASVFTEVALVAGFVSKAPTCDVPVASPGSGVYTSTQSVTLTQAQSKSMYYTIDGTTPTTGSTAYSGAISIATSTTLKVLAHDSGLVLADSIGTFFYTITTPPPPNRNIAITWQRRTRFGGAWLDGTGTVPLNEEAESYDLIIYDPTGTTIIRQVLGLTSPSFNYTTDMQLADFAGFPDFIYTVVYQNSAAVGRGIAAINPTLGLD